MESVSVQDLARKLGTLKGLPERRFVLLTATRVDGVPWCPDCLDAEPLIEEAAAQGLEAGAHILRVEISRKEWPVFGKKWTRERVRRD